MHSGFLRVSRNTPLQITLMKVTNCLGYCAPEAPARVDVKTKIIHSQRLKFDILGNTPLENNPKGRTYVILALYYSFRVFDMFAYLYIYIYIYIYIYYFCSFRIFIFFIRLVHSFQPA